MATLYEGVPNDSGTLPGEEEDLYGGKFSSVEDLEQAYRDLEGKIGEQGSELGAVRQEAGQLRELLTEQVESSPEIAPEPIPMVGEQPDWDALVTDPTQQAQVMIDTAVNQAVSRVSELYEQEQDNAGRRDTFYESHPDLAPFADNVVSSVNARVAQEYPDLTEDQFFAKVAEEARNEVNYLRQELGAPPQRRGSSQILSQGAQTPPNMSTPVEQGGVTNVSDDERQDEIDNAVMEEFEEAARIKQVRRGTAPTSR